MTKTEAIELFGGKQSALAEAIGVTRSYVSQWPDGELEQRIADRVVGAAIRLGKLAPTFGPVPAERIA